MYVCMYKCMYLFFYLYSGDYVAEDEAYVVIETDKVSVDIRATDGGGILKKQMAEEGDTVEVGAPLVTFEHAEAPAMSESPAAPPAAAAPAAEAPSTPAPTPASPPPAAPKVMIRKFTNFENVLPYLP
jgi:pyruvate/2-oxoglutarate dehydrogenase complex dihydrolipoamide acyltransferase (E2) component